MKDLWSVIRIALSVMALPLLATAALSALSNNDSTSFVSENVAALRASNAEAPDSSFRHHSVAIDADGVVRGRVAKLQDTGEVTGLSEMRVSFMQHGSIASQSYSRPDGSFEVVGLAPGIYSFVASGSSGFAAFGVRVTADPNVATNNLMEIGTVSPKYERVIEIVGARLPKEIIIDEIPGFIPPPGGNHVEIINGKLNGTLNSLYGTVENGEVFLIKNQAVVKKAITGENGVFTFEGVDPGIYEFVGTANKGFAAFGFEAGITQPVLSANEEFNESPDKYVFVSTDSNPDSKNEQEEIFVVSPVSPRVVFQETLDVTLVNPDDYVVAYDSIEVNDPATIPLPETIPNTYVGDEIGYGIAQGGYGGSVGNFGGYSGGGGGFGGLGGLAGLGRAAILGWVLTELFDNVDFSRNTTPTPPTPST